MLQLVPDITGDYFAVQPQHTLEDIVRTHIYALLYTDHQATVADAVTSDAATLVPGGWWADPQAGNRLWLLRRQPLTAETRAETIRIVQACLQRDGRLSDVQVAAATETTPTETVTDVMRAHGVGGGRSASGVHLAISGQYHHHRFFLQLPI